MTTESDDIGHYRKQLQPDRSHNPGHRSLQERAVREIRTLRAKRRGLETKSRITLPGHEGGNPGDRQGESYEPPRQSSTLPAGAGVT